MIKALKGYKGPGKGRPEGNPFDEESPASDEFDMEMDPELHSPPGAKAKEKLKSVITTIKNPPAPPRTQAYAEPYAAGVADEYGAAWKILINIMIMFPWSLVLLLSFLVNKWQLMFRPIGGLLWYGVDWLDQRLPTLVDWMLWFWYQISLALHVLTVGINLGVIWIMWDNGSKASPFFIVAFYAFSHYCSAVTMFKELDMREAGSTYFADVLTLFQRCIDVLFYDIQMVASVIHSNRMLEGMTQVAFKGYEEARVAVTCLLFTIPCCIIIGVEYGVFMNGKLRLSLKDYRDLKLLTSWQDQLYAAVWFSVINSVEKILRFSLVDPWLHDKNDGFPLLYIRSHAARLPGSVVRDWLVRCKVALQTNKGQLVLKELYSHYTQQVKDTCASLSDPHKAYLLRKAMHYFNTQRQHRVEAQDKPLIEDLVADDISPGVQLSAMLADILEDASSLHSLSLADNHLDDTAVANIMRALASNGEVQLTQLDLSGNNMLALGTAAVAAVLASNHSIYQLSLAGCPLRDEGAMALAEALKTNISLYKLDLSNSMVGPEGAIALAAAVKVNPVLSCLNLSGTSIGSMGVEALCKALRSAGSSGLKELDLSHTAADDKAAAALAGLLGASRVLERLALTHTNMTDAGAQLLCNALQGNTTLQSINVSNNDSMDKSWQKLLNHLVKGKAKN